ncbi:hypothetical protein SUGI_0278200 [Cryptomeria japonica]|nr:hypothetical protein SUGI_0278200 [Cryptomeria japonica]
MVVKVCIISVQGIFNGRQFVSKMIQRQTYVQQFPWRVFFLRYWCSYGPKDNRKKSPNKKRAWTYQKKRGCTCHFIVKVLYGRADVAILIFKQPLHVDKNGEACHGVNDASNELRSQFAPNLSDECKAYIERLLLMDVSIDAIVDRHLDDPVFHDMLKKRDSFVTRKDVINAATRVHSIRSRKHVHDATSILEWKKQDEANFFFFPAAIRCR